ncbi:hypothetical protein Tcan_12010 [Toxocara canis]|uniref:Uncharacterized protein n=1 Tax=Toxocara canis TaxID=6265 RepID=A0A0B2UWP4_TOXCA|nr:hypothetical protein Tcan_12010 [Toxocara canis]
MTARNFKTCSKHMSTLVNPITPPSTLQFLYIYFFMLSFLTISIWICLHFNKVGFFFYEPLYRRRVIFNENLYRSTQQPRTALPVVETAIVYAGRMTMRYVKSCRTQLLNREGNKIGILSTEGNFSARLF